MSAASRSIQQEQLSHRVRVLEELQRRITVPKLMDYAIRNALPAAFGRWSTEQLEACMAELSPAPGGAAPMSSKKSSKRFLVTFPVSRPNKATAVVLEGDEPAAVAGVTQFVVAKSEDLKGAPMPVLLALVNAHVTTKVTKFADEESAVASAWSALTSRAEPPKEDGSAKTVKPRAAKAIDYAPKAKEDIRQVRVGTKVHRAIELLSQEGGVLLSELEAELSKTGKPVNARAWLGYDIRSVVGYGVKSTETEEGIRVHLVLPKGMKAPLAPKAEPVKAEPKPKAVKAIPPVPGAKAEEAAEAVPKAAAKKTAAKKTAAK